MSRRRSSAVFTIVVAVVMLLCAALMGFILLLSGAPGALVTGMVLASIPVAPLIASYLWPLRRPCCSSCSSR
jgi:protease PrsW